jgi:prepilin peptidase CpaA
MAVALRFRAQGAATRLGPMIVSTLAALVFPLLMALAASSDLITMRISNRLVAVLVVGFFVLAFAAQLPLQQIAMHTGLAVMVLAFGFAFFSFGWIGGGDAKLAAATSLWIGFGLLLPYVIYGALLGGALTLLLLGVRRCRASLRASAGSIDCTIPSPASPTASRSRSPGSSFTTRPRSSICSSSETVQASSKTMAC